jgi:hypothetical protein
MLTLEDVQVGRSAGARVVEHTVEDVPVVAPEPEPQFEHECKHPGCTRSFPSSAALERHVEFEHTARHDQDEKRRIAEYARLQEEREALARMEQMPDALPVWEREAVARGVEPGPE